MQAFLLKSVGNSLGLALVNEARRIKEVIYMALDNRLHLVFSDGREETMMVELDGSYTASLLGRKVVSIGHFAQNGFNQEPVDEYDAPLKL